MPLSTGIAAPARTNKMGLVHIYHKAVIGAAGAISSQDTDSGVTLALAAAGRYTATFAAPGFAEHVYTDVHLVQGTSPADISHVNGRVAYDVAARTLTFSLLNEAQAETNVANPTTMLCHFVFKNTALRP